MKGSLIISVHDFSPKYFSELEEVLSELDSNDVRKRSLLVVPNYKNHFPISKHHKTVERLVVESINRNEICLHGYDHSMRGFYHEFGGINYKEASDRIEQGKSELKQEGLNPVGFVPPFWKISKEGEHAVKNAGFDFLAKNPEIKDLLNNEVYYSIPVWFWPYPKPLDRALRVYDEFLAKVWNRSNDLVRVEVHPHDVHKSRPLDCGLKLIRYLSKDREIVSHKQYLDSKRVS